MRYQSTRDHRLRKSFREVVNEGLSLEGGLYIPETIPDLSEELPRWREWDYAAMAERVYSIYAGEVLDGEQRIALIKKTLSRFKTPEVAPLNRQGQYSILELFHGPTLSFKDVALQTLGGLFEHWPSEVGQRTVLGATSGDTGSAAIAGVQGKHGVRAFILFPEGRVSPVQELQMTTVPDENVQCIAIDGSFDDCQNIVKELFEDVEFRSKVGLSAVNSINWARITSQIVYYFYGYFSWLNQTGRSFGDELPVSVPTGNFGDILAGYVAKKMGLPLGKLIISSNDNDILTRFFETGRYDMKAVVPSWSPAMDIQISSNFERLLFLLHDRDGDVVSDKIKQLKREGGFAVDESVMAAFKKDFSAQRVVGDECLHTIKAFHDKHDYTLCPHSAVGVQAAIKELGEDAEVMCLATAHPGKFQDAVEKALGETYILPDELENLKSLPTRKQKLSASAQAVKELLLS